MTTTTRQRNIIHVYGNTAIFFCFSLGLFNTTAMQAYCILTLP
jgi:hypothetical protein